MTSREKFINEVDNWVSEGRIEFSEDAWTYFCEMRDGKTSGGITEKGQAILNVMMDKKDEYDNRFTANVIGEALGLNGRSVSGSIRKLVTDGYVEKVGEKPNVYSLTN